MRGPAEPTSRKSGSGGTAGPARRRGRRRSLARTLLTENPELSLRQVAHLAGVSPETVRRVRNRLLYGRPPAPPRTPATARDRTGLPDAGAILQKLAIDPALRQSGTGRAMLRLLHAQLVPGDEWERILTHLPTHCAGLVEQVAREFSRRWTEVAVRASEMSRATH